MDKVSVSLFSTKIIRMVSQEDSDFFIIPPNTESSASVKFYMLALGTLVVLVSHLYGGRRGVTGYFAIDRT